VKNQSSIKFILGITAKLLLICVVTALLLACVNALTADRIADNITKEKQEAISAIFPGSTESKSATPVAKNVTSLHLVYSNGKAIGYVAEVAPLGFGGELTLMVGVNVNGAVEGVKLIAHSETPGLGSRVGDAGYLSQYIGKDEAALEGGIDVITGSTVSSNALLSGVKTALSIYDLVYPMFVDGGAK